MQHRTWNMKTGIRNSVFTIVALHILVWGILFYFPFFFTIGEAPVLSIYFRSMLPLLFSLLLFYVNYLILIDKILFKNKIAAFIIINLVLIVLCIWGLEIARELIPNPLLPRSNSGRNRPRTFDYRAFSLFRTGFSFLLTIGVSVGIKATQNWLRLERERKVMETEQLKSTLTHLQYQIQPHFFFNSLNNIYSLVDVAPEKAKDSIHRMSKLMRYLLYNVGNERIALNDEILFLKNYIQLMQLRLTDKVDVQFSFPETIQDTVQIAPLLFIPLVENGFKHGVSASHPSFISIKMRIENQQLIFEVENTNFPKDERDKGGSGIGIENLEKRLRLLYPKQHTFEQQIENEVFKSKLVIDLKTPKP